MFKAYWSKFMNGKLEKEDFVVFTLLAAVLASVLKVSVSTRGK